MIIGYYPGAGGNRYYQYINSLDFSQTGIEYDTIVRLPQRGIYLNESNQIKDKTDPTILLHCVNYARISQETDRSDIVIIKSDLKDSLCREWSLKGKFKPMFFPNADIDAAFLLELYRDIKDSSWPDLTDIADYKNLPMHILKEMETEVQKNKELLSTTGTHNFLSSAYTAIIWHHNFYKKYPFDPGPAQVIDVDMDSSEFAAVMRRELVLSRHSKLFNFAWEVFDALGRDAPVVTLFYENNIIDE